MNSTRTAIRNVVVSLLVLFLCVMTTILLHAILPAKVSEASLDGALVRRFGFPMIATLYFAVLYAQCTLVLFGFRKNLADDRIRTGLLIGTSYALLYMIGMQEIIIDSGSLTAWDKDYVIYQLLIGLGDAIPVILLNLIICMLLCCRGEKAERRVEDGMFLNAVVFAVVVGTLRLLESKANVIHNCYAAYPWPVSAWGYALGLTFGISYGLVGKITRKRNSLMLVGLGINWIVFNSFIGVIKKGALVDALLRGVLDIGAVAISILAIGWLARLHAKRNKAAASG